MQTIKNSGTKSAFVFLAAIVLFAACRPPGVRGLLEGKKLLEQGKYPQAAEKLRLAAGLLDNTNAQAFNYLGLACHQAGQVAEAEKAYRRALALNPDLTEAHYNLGCLLFSENKLEPAKAELIAYTLRRGNSAPGWLTLGHVQLRLSATGSAASRSSELLAAEKSFEEALHLEPKSAEGLNALGVVRLRRNHASEAANLFSRALKEQPDYRPALLNLAVVAQQNLNQPRVALQKYRECLGLTPPAAEVEEITLIAHQLEQQLAPVPHTAETSGANQTNANTPTNKPVQLEIARPTTPAKPQLSNSTHTVLALKPESNVSLPKPRLSIDPPKVASNPEVTAFSNVEVIKLPPEPVFKPAEDIVTMPPRAAQATGEPRLATSAVPAPARSAKAPKRTLLQRLNPLNLFATDGNSLPPTPLPSAGSNSAADVVDSFEAHGNQAEAGPRYVYASPAPPAAGNRADAERFFGQAVRAQQNQQLAEAIKDYQRAAQLDPSFYDVEYNLGLAATQAGDLPLALGAYETALAIRPDSLDARYNFALVLKQANYTMDAANELDKILEHSPDESRAHLALGNLYAQQVHDFAKARRHYLKVVEIDPHNPQADAIRYWLTVHPR